MVVPEEFTREEAIAMGAFNEDALTLEDVLAEKEITELIEQGVDVTVEKDS